MFKGSLELTQKLARCIYLKISKIRISREGGGGEVESNARETPIFKMNREDINALSVG